MIKKMIFIVFPFFVLIGKGVGQATVSDVFDDDVKTLWLGLDFTEFKITGEDITPDNLKPYFVRWNSLILREREEKYHLSVFFDKKNLDTRVGIAFKQIDTIDAEKRISEGYGEVYRLEKADVSEVAAKYKISDTDASLGILFVMEQFNKGLAKGSMWVTFIDLKTGKVLLTERVEEVPGKDSGIDFSFMGPGTMRVSYNQTSFRNYWASSYFNVMEKVEDDLLDEWEDKYDK